MAEGQPPRGGHLQRVPRAPRPHSQISHQRRKRLRALEGLHAAAGFADWTLAGSGAKLLKAQHPEFETWSQGIHARSVVACADCHMPYAREGAIKISDHQVRSPLLNPSRSCQTCHRYAEKEILARAEAIQDRTKALLLRAEQATVGRVQELANAKKSGAADDALQAAQSMRRQAQWRLDFVAAENSMEFHAPQESARILAEAIDLAHRGRLELPKPEKQK